AGQLSLPHSSSASRFTAGAAITSQAKCELDHLVANSLPLSFAARSIGLQADMHKVIARVTWSALLAAAISLVFCTTGLTHEDWPDGPHKEWFQNLQRPDNDAPPHRRLDHKSLLRRAAAAVLIVWCAFPSSILPSALSVLFTDNLSSGARRERPRRRAAEKGDELAPPHSITSSASC